MSETAGNNPTTPIPGAGRLIDATSRANGRDVGNTEENAARQFGNVMDFMTTPKNAAPVVGAFIGSALGPAGASVGAAAGAMLGKALPQKGPLTDDMAKENAEAERIYNARRE
ncbi:hypothetical protein FGB62_133g024 [Gracilaria domingensis]|nr:hypothetical protein FGB62_133g024 [Gracilaria domingensis]